MHLQRRTTECQTPEPDAGRRRAPTRALTLIVLAALVCATMASMGRSARVITTVDVRTYGASGNGRHDDTRAFVRAMRAAIANAATLYVPRGTYRLGSLVLPDGLVIRGDGNRRSWLKGAITFGSHQRISSLTLGTNGGSTRNRAGAHDTRFTRCRFRGGGGTSSSGLNVLTLYRPCDHITFTDCEVERNLITDATRDANQRNKQFSDVGIIGGPSGRVDSITFNRCRIGVSNGLTAAQGVARNTGSPFAGLICWTPPDTVGKGWSNINLIDTVIEVCDWHCIDLACPPPVGGAAHGGPALISGCTIKGSYNSGIAIEGPVGVEVTGCTIYPCSYYMLSVISFGDDATLYMNADIHDNVFDGVTDMGGPSMYGSGNAWGAQVRAGGNTFTNNVIDVKNSQMCFLDELHHGTVRGNVFRDHAVVKTTYGLVLKNCSSNDLSNNAVWTRDPDFPSSTAINLQGTNTSNNLTGTTYTRAPTPMP